ncbi:MAG: hypothetical protein EOP09_04370 [Proteobacteria bacterium]|nr:MAG: hypothetical protein EOP09_04370 [Pseudomonadota bacterium]
MGKIFWRHPGHLVWILFAYLPFLGRFGIPLTGDQKTYIAVAMEMREKGEWLRPLLFGEGNYLKPPFQYWMTLLGWKAFGFNLFGTFVPSVIALALTAWFLSEIASSLGERRWYVNSGLWFAATIGAMTYGTTAQMEIYVCLFYTAAWWAAMMYFRVNMEERSPAWLYLAFIIAGVSSLVKSPLYAVLWVLSFCIYGTIAGEWLLLKSKHLYLALAVGVAVGLAWFVVILGVDGDRFWDQYWIQEQVNKKGGNGSTIWNLWGPLFYMAFPFTLLAITAARALFLRRRSNSIITFLVAWCLPPAIFFSAYPYRTSVYLFILVPALAILVDWGCFRTNRTRTFMWASRGTGLLLFVALALAALALHRAEFIPVWLALALVFTGSAAVIVSWMGWMRVFAICSLGGILFFRIAAVEVVSGDTQRLVDAIAKSGSNGELAMLDEARNIWHEIGLVSVTLEKPMRRLYGLDDCVDLLKRGGLLILSDEEYERYHQTLKQFMNDQGLELVSEPWRRFKRRQRLPIREVLLDGRAAVPDFDDIITREFQIVVAKKKDQKKG